MILEQSLFNPNFIGRDGFRWFIGVITDIRDCAQDSGGYRVKVRIIGHHPGDEYLKDKDLPWAQVLVPLNMGSGNFGTGCSFNAQGGSTVIGFFLDGDDGQQPIIIGSLFTGSNVEHIQEYTKGTAFFNQFKPKTGYITNPFNIPLSSPQLLSQTSTNKKADNIKQGETPPAGIPRQNGNDPINVGSSAGAKATQNSEVVSIVSECKTGKDTYSKILQALRYFVKTLVTIKNIQGVYIDPVLNRVVSLPSLISSVSTAIYDAISLHIKTARDSIITQIYTRLKENLDQVRLPKELDFLKKVAFGEITDGIWCAIGKILRRILGFIDDFLKNMINAVVSFPLCALEAVVGSILQAITNEIVNAITPIIQEFASTIGGAISEASSFVSLTINFAKELINFLSCENKTCKEQFDYEMNKGFVPKENVNFSKFINYSPAQGINNLAADGNKAFQNFLGIGPPPPNSQVVGRVETSPGVFTVDYLTPNGTVVTRTEGGENLVGNCNIVNLECGLPKVSLFGGGGSGATGNAVVDSLGQVMGINLTNPGSGYTSPPKVYFEDSCDNGRGAVGIAEIGEIEITNSSGEKIKTTGVKNVVITNSGTNYLGPNSNIGIGSTSATNIGAGITDIIVPPGVGSTITSPCDIDPIDESGVSVVGIITGVLISNTGINYSNTDIIVDSACNNDIRITPIVDDDGRIIDVNIINPGTSIRVFPRLEINTESGEGAVLFPILSFNRSDDVSRESSDPNAVSGKINKVVYCAGDHGNKST